jgi:hypothetical protein
MMKIVGFDFTSRPSRLKPITRAQGELRHRELVIAAIDRLENFGTFEAALRTPGNWIAGLDFPFSQPRDFIEKTGWPLDWRRLIASVANLGRSAFEQTIVKYREEQPAGNKHPLRMTDRSAQSCSPLTLYGTPVGKMFYEGATRIAAAPISVIPCGRTTDERVAVEAYPALVVRKVIAKASYKSDARKKQTPDKADRRRQIVEALRCGALETTYGFRATAVQGTWNSCVDDPTGDLLDAVLCCVQAAWAFNNTNDNYGIPLGADALEGWITDPELR